MGYTVDKKTGKIILVHDVTVEMPEPPKPTPDRTTSTPCPIAATSFPATTSAAHVPDETVTNDTFTFPVTRQKVRTVWHEGNVWFVAKDVAECLGFKDTDDAIRKHCNHAKTLKPGKTPGLTSSPTRHQHHPRIRRLPSCHALQTPRR